MKPGALPLSAADLAGASLLVLVAGGVSLLLRLKLEKKIAVAALRTVVQLLGIGYVLRLVFSAGSLTAMAPVLLIMVAAAARAAVHRPKRSFAGAAWLAFLTLSLTGLALTGLATRAVIGVQPWWSPQYLIPLLGMILGNALTGVSLCLDSLLDGLVERRAEVENALSLGASAWEAAQPLVAEAVRKGMIPILNSMTVVGLVSLPGMMTGQILAGADPMEAVKYQVLIMFLLCATTALGGIGIALLSYRVLFNERHQLEVAKIVTRD